MPTPTLQQQTQESIRLHCLLIPHFQQQYNAWPKRIVALAAVRVLPLKIPQPRNQSPVKIADLAGVKSGVTWQAVIDSTAQF